MSLRAIFEKFFPYTFVKFLVVIKAKLKGILTNSYSGDGEDKFLMNYFKNKKNGFYVDIGAHDPLYLSNTYIFYKKGWRGINIDPTPGIMVKFNKIRPNDINLEIPISDKKEILKFNLNKEPSHNSFLNSVNVLDIKEVETFTLNEIFDKYIKSDINIDFISIDTEGFDYKVLTSFDINKYRPNVIIIENEDKKIDSYLSKNEYVKLFKSRYNLIYKDNKF